MNEASISNDVTTSTPPAHLSKRAQKAKEKEKANQANPPPQKGKGKQKASTPLFLPFRGWTI